jgi:Tol biopolymer transport system component
MISSIVAASGAAAEPQRVTHDGVRKLAPVFADGGETVYFSMHREPTRVALFRLCLADGMTEPVETTLTEHQFDPDVSGDGRYLCFVLTAGSPQSVLVIRDRVEQKEARYTPREARGTVRNPKLDVKHGRVVFTVSDPGGQQIAAVDLSGQNFKLLTQSTGTNGWPAVSPDGEQIAFTSSQGGSLQLYVMSPEGDRVHALTDGPQRNMRPAWSPDGTQLAYTSSIDGDLEVCVMQADGSNIRRLTDHPGRDDFPAWHPDGRRLLFVSERDGDCDLYMTDVEPVP